MDTSFFFKDTATTEIYTLSLHDALPISQTRSPSARGSDSAPSPAEKPPDQPFPGKGNTLGRDSGTSVDHSDLEPGARTQANLDAMAGRAAGAAQARAAAGRADPAHAAGGGAPPGGAGGRGVGAGAGRAGAGAAGAEGGAGGGVPPVGSRVLTPGERADIALAHQYAAQARAAAGAQARRQAAAGRQQEAWAAAQAKADA